MKKHKQSERKAYFRKQKLCGLAFILLGILTAIILEGDITVAILLVPIGIYLLLSKKMLVTNDYYYEVKQKEEWRR